MFKSQPPHQASDALLDRLGATMEEQPSRRLRQSVAPTRTTTTPPTRTPTRSSRPGFTFVGQFVDHDITFDTTSLNDQQSDPDATTNFRTPRYDLDAIYGRGPNLDPQFYNPTDRDKFLIVETPYSEIKAPQGRPLSRSPRTRSRHRLRRAAPTARDGPDDPPAGTAIIADPRNDQTLIILQLHVALQMFHNKLVDTCARSGYPAVGGVRVGSASGPVALPVDRDPRVHAGHRGHRPMTDSVYKETTKAPIINLKYYKPTNPAGTPLHPGRVRGGRVPLRPQHHPAPLHRSGRLRPAPAQLSVAPSPARRCSRTPSPTTTN